MRVVVVKILTFNLSTLHAYADDTD